MAIDNNVNRNTFIGATAGGIAGATVACVSKPYLAHGSPKKDFLLSCVLKHKDFKNVSKRNEHIKALLEKANDISEIEKIIADNKIDIPEIANIKSRNNPEEAKIIINSCLDIDQRYTSMKIIDDIRNSVKNWKNIKSELKNNVQNFTTENREVLQKTIKAMNIKYALLFGIIGATIAGFATHLISKKSS